MTESKQAKKIKNLNLKLSDVKSVDPSINGILTTFISLDGSSIYQLNGAFGPVTTGVPAAQFAKNISGKIVYVSSIPSDSTFVNVDDGSPNPKFTQFTLLDDNGLNTGRVRVFNALGQVVGQHLFDDLSSSELIANTTFAGGTWSSDGAYIAIFYTLNTSTDTVTNSVVRVLYAGSPELPVVASFTISGVSQAPWWFNLPKKSKKCDRKVQHYIVLAPGNISSSGVVAGSGCPNDLIVLKFNGLSLSQVASASLPSFSVGVKAWPSTPCEIKNAQDFFDKQDTNEAKDKLKVEIKIKPKSEDKPEDQSKFDKSESKNIKVDGKCCDKFYDKCYCDKKCNDPKKLLKRRYALIAVNTTVSVGSDQVSPFTVAVPSCTGSDARELRLYAFDGKCLTLLTAQDTQLRGVGVTFSPDGRFLLAEVATRNLVVTETPAQFSATMYVLKVPLDDIYSFFVKAQQESKKSKRFELAPCKDVICLKPVRIIGGFPNSYVLSFSMNSEWFIIGGNGIIGASSTLSDVFSIQLYRVVSSKC